MASIEQIVAQIRTAIYGRDVRENIAQGIEKCYTDVTAGVTTADTAAGTATTAAATATAAAESVGTAITNAQTATTAANTAASSANASAGKIDNMEVEASALTSDQNPTATVTEVSGHKKIAFGIPRGAIPNFSIGEVVTLRPGNSATVEIEGTAASPVLNFSIPRGYDGETLTTNRIWYCTTAASTTIKEVTITTEDFTLEEGGLYVVYISNKNTADTPKLKINNTDAKFIYINGDKIESGYTKYLISGMCLFVYDGTNYNLIGNFYNGDIDTITNAEIDALFEEEGGT